MVEPNLTHDEKAVLAGLLRTTIAADRYRYRRGSAA